MKLFGTMAMIVALVLAAATGATAAASDTYEQAVKDGGNIQRLDHGAGRLKHSDCLDRYAERWAKQIASKKALTHRTSAMFVTIMKACGKTTIGENLAYGQATGGAVVTAWMNSPGHRANLLNKKFKTVGIGSVQVDGRWWTAQLLSN